MTYHFGFQSDALDEQPVQARWGVRNAMLFAIVSSAIAWSILIVLARHFL